MAKLIKKTSTLEKQYRRQRTRGIRYLLLSALGILGILVGIHLQLPVVLGVGILWWFVCILLAVIPVRDLNALKAGIDGEAAAAKLLKQLPSSYQCYQNVVVSSQGKTSEMDLVAVGPTGVFIIETKNLNGHITGGWDAQNWTLHKTGRRGGAYEKSFYSPVKQVGTHIYRLAHYLRERDCRVHIDAAVLFIHPDTSVSLHGTPGDIPVYAGKEGGKALLRHITDSNTTIPPQMLKKLHQLLEKCL